VSSTALFDALSLTDHLELVLNAPYRGEIRLFSYLACVLSVYDRHPASTWGYSFFATRDGSPFSSDLNNALEQCITLRYLTSDETSQERVFSLTDEGSESLYGLRTLTRCQSRGVFIEASCSSALAIPSGLVRRAITPEPDLRAARALNSNRSLLQEDSGSYEILSEQLAALRDAVGREDSDLLVPALAWIKFHLGTDGAR